MGCWVLVGLRRVQTGWQAACLKNTVDGEDEGEVEVRRRWEERNVKKR